MGTGEGPGNNPPWIPGEDCTYYHHENEIWVILHLVMVKLLSLLTERGKRFSVYQNICSSGSNDRKLITL